MVTRQSPAEGSGPIVEDPLRAASSRNPAVSRAIEFLFQNATESPAFGDLRIQPLVSEHRNLVEAEPFFLPRERFGGSQDIAMVPLIRNAVDETLRAFANSSPHLLGYVGKTPISPYGSLGLSVSRWGQVDWDYIRDMDWRIFLPPELGHLSGFKSHLERLVTEELHKYGLYPLLFGKDAHGLDQVQLRDTGTGEIHGFHFFLVAMKPGFARGKIHRDGGYSPYFAFFPESSLDEHLESASLLWSDVIAQLRDDYTDMFNQLSFNIFGENSDEDRLQKTKGWYLHKSFKWYATLARSRGLSPLEEDLLYQYEHFRGSEAELSYMARYRYYARMSPSPQHLDDVDRDLARTASIAYARARNAEDPLVGRQLSVDGAEIILLESVREEFRAAARKLLDEGNAALPDRSKRAPGPGPIRFADNLPAPTAVHIEGQGQAVLIPAEWSMVFCDAYAGQAAKKAADESRAIAERDIRQALAALLASQLRQAARCARESGSEAGG